MKILYKEKKGLKLNTLESFYIYDLTKKGLQLNDTFTDMYNPIFYLLIKTDSHLTPHPNATHNINPPSYYQYTIDYIKRAYYPIADRRLDTPY
jgi:hypothetical protein